MSERPKLLKNLTIPQIDKIAKDLYGIMDLNTKQRKDVLIARVKEAMLQDQDCVACQGECDPESHPFLPQQFTVSGSPTNNTFAAELAEFLSSRNVSTDSPVGDQTTPFVESQESVQRLLQAAHDHLGDSSQSSSASGETTAATGDTTRTPSSDTTTTALVHLLQQQQIQQQNQNKLMETMVNVMSELAPKKPVQVDLTSENNEPSRGKITVERNINLEHAQYSGLALQPLCRVEGDLNTVDLSKMKTTLKSGEHSLGSLAVLREVYWPHHGLPKARMNGQAPPYNQLSPVQFFCGLINAILVQTPPELNGTETINKVKFAGLIATMALNNTWADVLSHNADFFRQLEQAQLDWTDYEAIRRWHLITEEGLRAKNSFNQNQPQPSAKRLKPDNQQPAVQGGGWGVQDKDFKVCGIEVSFMRLNQICIKFQTGKCTLTTDHNTIHENVTLRHICAGCVFLKKPEDRSHNSKTCPNKSQFFL